MKELINVMLIEDDPMVQEVNRMFIERVPGYRVCATAGNGEDGLDKISTFKPDLVLLDNFMPKKNGLKTLQAFRQNETDVDVIVISAAQDKETIRTMMRLGAFDYIIKPFKFERLRQALEHYQAFKKQLMGEGTIRQQELDHIQGVASNLTAYKTDLPKGLNQQTLNQITQFMKSQTAPLSAEEAAEGIGIARVTARRYLDYLQKTEQVKIIIEYGSIGRPINRYKWM